MRRLSLLLLTLLAICTMPASAQPSFGTQTAASPGAEDEPAVRFSIQSSAEAVAPGSEMVLAVILDHAEHWHTNLNQPIVPEEMGDFFPVPTTILLPEVEGLSFGAIQWPDPLSVPVDFLFTGNPVQYQVYGDRAIIYIPIEIDDDAVVGDRAVEVTIKYQACDDTTCLPPTSETLRASFRIDPNATSSDLRANEVFAGYDPAKATIQGDPAQISRKFLGFITLPAPDSVAGVAVLAFFAAVGGFVLNLTPCVLPVIPIKVMTITQHAGEKKSKALMLSLWMATGVIAFWIAIGIPMAFVAETLDPSKIFGLWWLTALIGIVILAMGIGIMGLFQIKLPQKVYMVNPKADSAWGSFVFGIMTAVLGLPCFGFVAGALLAGAATMPPMLVMTIFAFMGIGMALPYVVLAVFPALLKSVPRTGPASELVKQVMGLLMIAAAAYFLGTSVISYGSGHGWNFVWWGKTVHWWAIGLVGVATGLLLVIQTIRITKSLGKRAVFGIIGLFFAFSGSYVAYGQTMHQYHNFWQPYSREFLQASLDNGQIVVLDFTAEWCLNCKTLEAAVLSKEPVKPELLSADVVPMVADLTSLSAPGWSFLNNDLGQTGIPFLAIFSPGQEDPVWVSNAYTSKQVLEGIELARSRR
ncbi:MAG: thioredoxin family protein [Phycisphaerales bacterium]|nr:thioredoxin family protein [Phycisphaerales bacterium]